jgi:hypothetical protein
MNRLRLSPRSRAARSTASITSSGMEIPIFFTDICFLQRAGSSSIPDNSHLAGIAGVLGIHIREYRRTRVRQSRTSIGYVNRAHRLGASIARLGRVSEQCGWDSPLERAPNVCAPNVL